MKLIQSEIDDFVKSFLLRQQGILGESLVGMYPYGSLSIGDFDAESSDIDLIVITDRTLEPKQIHELKQHISSLSEEWPKFARRIELAYLSRQDAASHFSGEKHFLLSPVWNFQMTEFGADWILNRAVARMGKAIFGPDPKEVFDEVPKEEIIDVERKLLCEVWSKHVAGPDWMRPKRYQAFAVLTVCRMLYGIAHGSIVSKPHAASWVSREYPQWKDLIARALHERNNNPEGQPDETLAFLKFAIRMNCRQEGRQESSLW